MKRIILAIALFALLNGLTAYGQEPFYVRFEIPCPDFPGFPDCPPITRGGQPSIANYINNLFRFAIGIVGIIAVGAIVVGAIEYSVSAGNTDRQSDAKNRITSALWGIILLLGAVLIFNIVNPRISKLVEPRACGPGEKPETHYCLGRAPTISFAPFAVAGSKACSSASIASLCAPNLSDEDFQECVDDHKQEISKKEAEVTNECSNKYPSGGAFFYNTKQPDSYPSCLPFYQVTSTPPTLIRDKRGNPILHDYSKTEYKSC